MKPRYVHDCEDCVFIGQLYTASNELSDIYLSCQRRTIGLKYLVRSSDEPSDYMTCSNLGIFFPEDVNAQ